MFRRAVLALAVAATLGLTGCATGHDAVNQVNGDAGGDISTGTTLYAPGHRDTAPPVTGTLLDGSTFDLAAQAGHVVVVNFWGAWCGPCRAETADLQSVHTATASAGVVFVGVDIQDDHDSATSYVSAHHVTYPSIFDTAGRVLRDFDAVPPTAIPSTVVIDAAGRIASLHLGAITDKELTTMIAKASS